MRGLFRGYFEFAAGSKPRLVRHVLSADGELAAVLFLLVYSVRKFRASAGQR